MENSQRICANPECQQLLKRKSRKAKYCSIQCKNRGNFLLRKTKYESEDAFTKGYRKNCKIIAFLFNNGTRAPSLDALIALGMDFEAFPAAGTLEDGRMAPVFGEFIVIPIFDTQFQIIKKQ